MADAVVGAKKGQKRSGGDDNTERMLKRLVWGEGQLLLRGTRMDARRLAETELMDGAPRHDGRTRPRNRGGLQRADPLTRARARQLQLPLDRSHCPLLGG